MVYIRVKEGQVRPGDTIRMMATGAEFDVVETGIMRPGRLEPTKGLTAGEVGYITASHQDRQRGAGRRYRHRARTARAESPLPGYQKVNPMVFCGIYPGGRRAISRPARGAGATAAQRRVADL